MSSSMYWRPVPKDVPPGQWLDDGVRYKLGERLWGSGSLRNEAELDGTDIAYLEGLADGGVKGARDLLDAIRAHGRVKIWIGDADER